MPINVLRVLQAGITTKVWPCLLREIGMYSVISDSLQPHGL